MRLAPDFFPANVSCAGRTLAGHHRPREGATSLVLLHGVLRNSEDWLPLLAPLAAHFDLWLLDQRGHGDSAPAASYVVEDYVADAVEWIERAVARPVVLLGHSLGAMVAARIAGERPDLIRGVILEDPPFHTLGNRIRETSFHAYFAALAPWVGAAQPAWELARGLAELRYVEHGSGRTIRLGDVRDAVALRFLAACLRRVDPRVIEPLLAGTWLSGYDCEETFRRLRCPALMLQADPTCGGMLHDRELAALQSLAPDVLTIRYPGAGHALHWQRSVEVLNTILSFCASLA